MKRLDRILAVLDPTADSQPGLEKAAQLAQKFGARVELFVCDFDPALTGRPFFDTDGLRRLRDDFISERTRWMEQKAQQIGDRGIATETHIHWDNPLYRGIVRRVEESSPDLVVKDTHYHSAIRRTLLSNTDWNLIRTCPAPLLLAKAEPWSEPPRLLAALDPGHAGDTPASLDHEILDYGEMLAKRLGGELHAVHAFFPAALLAAVTGMAGIPSVAGVSSAEIIDGERKRIARELDEILDAHELSGDRMHLLQGAAVQVLPKLASDMAIDILVMGGVSRSRLKELFIGSTAEHIIDRIACDVLVVKTDDFAEKLSD
jgi:universal stress protein E